MKYKVTIDKDEGFVRITVYEPITAKLEQEFAGEAIAVAKKNDLLRYLVDVRAVPNIANTVDQYTLPYEDVAPLGLSRSSRIAVLVEENDTSHNFIETVFRNAGYNCQLFVDEDEARNWLRK